MSHNVSLEPRLEDMSLPCSSQEKEEEQPALSLVKEEHLEVTKTNSEEMNHEPVAQEITDPSPFQPLQNSIFLGEPELTSFMFEDEASYGENNEDFKITMQKGESFLQKDNKEFDFLSDSKECFDKKDLVEIAIFSPPSFILQSQEPVAMEENV